MMQQKFVGLRQVCWPMLLLFSMFKLFLLYRPIGGKGNFAVDLGRSAIKYESHYTHSHSHIHTTTHTQTQTKTHRHNWHGQAISFQYAPLRVCNTFLFVFMIRKLRIRHDERTHSNAFAVVLMSLLHSYIYANMSLSINVWNHRTVISVNDQTI